jgi:hypothetical protein
MESNQHITTFFCCKNKKEENYLGIFPTHYYRRLNPTVMHQVPPESPKPFPMFQIASAQTATLPYIIRATAHS